MRKVHLLGITVVMLLFFSGCMSNDSLTPTSPIEESYEYTTMNRVYAHPALLTVERQVAYLSLTNDDGFFFCDTTDTEKADEFINAQRTLLQFLRSVGMETPKLNYFAMDFDDSFSESEKNRAHIGFSHVKSSQQVLITLQTIWGDYTDYGYLHAVANAIASHLGWTVDTVEEVECSKLDAFFTENPDALNLLYPCFTTTYASEETVRNCKSLSKQLLEKMDLYEALTKPVSEQVNSFRVLVDTYAQEVSVTFSRQESGYAYCGEYLPLKISTPYVLHFIDRNYDDYCRAELEKLGDNSWDYFSDYQSIFETIDIINKEIARSVSRFSLEDVVGIVTMNWFCTECATELFNNPEDNFYVPQQVNAPYDGTIYLTRIDSYLHEYFHHIDAVLSDGLDQTWQEQAFADLGHTQSQHARYVFEWPFLYDEQYRALFSYIYGREYQGGIDDYYDAYDILCSAQGSYEFDYNTGRRAWKSFTHYLLSLYEEDTVGEIFLFPETVETVTDKTWEELKVDWQHYMAEKFKIVESPN